MSVTLAEIKTQCRQRADMENSEFVSDSELVSYINNSIAELHDLLIAAYNEEYYMEELEFPSVANQRKYALPADFYKLRGVDFKLGQNEWSTVKRFNFNRRNDDESGFSVRRALVPYLSYRLVGSDVMFSRVPDQNTTFRIWYYPRAVKLAADTDVYDDFNGYIEYVIIDAAIKMMQKEESDVRVLASQKAAMKERIETMAKNRDSNEPDSVTDVYAENTEYYRYGGG